MKCEKYQNIISDYLDDNLAGHERFEFELHVEKCAACARMLAQTENLLVGLNSLGSREPPVSVWNGVRDAIAIKGREQLTWLRIHWRPLLAAPALVLSIVAYFLFTQPAQMPKTDTIISTPEYGSYITAHSRAQGMAPLSDPDVALVSAELEKASLVSGTTRQ